MRIWKRSEGKIRAVAQEREACAKIAEEMVACVRSGSVELRKSLDSQQGLTYSMGFEIAAQRITDAIRARRAK